MSEPMNDERLAALRRLADAGGSITLSPQGTLSILDFIEAIKGRAAAAERERDELLAAQQWQPIETAPKERIPIMVWGVTESERENAEDDDRDEEHSAIVAVPSHAQHGLWWMSGASTEVYEVTHWQPLPAPPQPR